MDFAGKNLNRKNLAGVKTRSLSATAGIFILCDGIHSLTIADRAAGYMKGFGLKSTVLINQTRVYLFYQQYIVYI